MILSITIQKTKKQKAVKANLPHRWLHSKTHTLFIFTPDVQGQELIHLPLKPSHMKKRNIWLWADKRFQRRSKKKKKKHTHIRSSNFPSHFTPPRKRLYSAIQMQPVKGGLKFTSAFLFLPEINLSSF